MKLLVACDPNGGIGYKGKLPWDKIQGDLPRFKKLTTGKVILMGRKTWESLPIKPLPNRINVVVTKSSIPDITTISDLPSKDTMDLKDVWCIGGAKVIRSSWHLIDEVHLSRVFAEYKCDTYVDLKKLQNEFVCVSKETCTDHDYEIWKRKWNNITIF